MSPYIIALDASLANTGWVVYKVEKNKWSAIAHGIIQTSKSAAKRELFCGGDNTRRWKLIVAKLVELNDKYRFSALACEITSGGVQNASAAKSLFGAQALVIAFCDTLRIPAVYVSPRDVKIALVGNASASKLDMMEQADKVTGIGQDYLQTRKGTKNKYETKYEHVADAVGVFEAVKDHDILKMMEKVSES